MSTAPGRGHLAGDTARGWGWVAHLRAGGTTAWRDWSAPAQDAGPYLPGAQQLELLRRLNLAGAPSAALAARTLAASAPGRGRPDLELLGASGPGRFGPAPVDPSDLPDHELVRVATGLLADDLAAAGPPAPPSASGRSRAVTRLLHRRRSLLLAGDPWQILPLRAELVRRGRPPGERGSRVLVLGADLPTLLAHAWTARVFAGGAPGWREWLRGAAGRDRLPRRADLTRLAAEWAAELEPSRVTIVLDERALPRLLGVRRPLPGPPDLGVDAVELARRTAPALGLLVRPPERAELLRGRLLPWLRDLGPAGLPAIPEPQQAWVEERAVAMRATLSRGGYPVVGDPDTLLPGDRTSTARGADGPTEAGVLELAVRLLLATDAREEGR